MADKKQTRKRRVADAQRAQRAATAAAKQERRRKLIIGGLVGFLALALIAPLTAGLIASSGSDVTTTVPPTTTLAPLPWVPAEFAGDTLTGATPCPAVDGTASRTTGFASAPPMCIDADATFDLEFDSAAGSFAVPIDASLSSDAANLAAVFGWYRTYEQVTVEAAPGILFVGGGGDTGFTIPLVITPPPVGEGYAVGSVLAVNDGTGIDGSLMVVLDEAGGALLQASGPHQLMGMVDDVAPLQEILDDPLLDGEVRIDGVRVVPTS